MRMSLRDHVRRFVLVAGLVFCGLALWKLGPAVGDVARRIGPSLGVAVLFALAVAWFLAIAAWRVFVRAFAGKCLPWPQAIRQSGLLLVGKYVPGGVFGFLARHQDATTEVVPRQAMVAGLYEQVLTVLTPSAAGGVVYLAARSSQPALLLLLLLLPMALVVSLRMGGGLILRLPIGFVRGMALGSGWATARFRLLLTGEVWMLAATLVWLGVVAAVAYFGFQLGAYAAMGVAGAFGVAVGAGMLVVIAPGGIGAREAALVVLASAWITGPSAVLLALVLRLLSMLLDLAAGLVAASMSMHNNPTTQEGQAP